MARYSLRGGSATRHFLIELAERDIKEVGYVCESPEVPEVPNLTVHFYLASKAA